jgi:hypothetical protein
VVELAGDHERQQILARDYSAVEPLEAQILWGCPR